MASIGAHRQRQEIIRKGSEPFAVCAILILLAVSAFAKTAEYSFSSAGEFPTAPLTVPLADSLTQIVGYYWATNSGGQFGYLQTAIEKSHPPFLSLQPPGGWFAFAAGINNHGVAVGGYCVPPQECNYPQTMHGFSFSHGTYTTIDYPTADATGAYGINDQGQIVGGFCLTVTPCAQSQIPTDHGFLNSNSTFTQLDYPGAQSTQAEDINNAGTIVGFYDTNAGGPHSFIYRNGQYKNIDFPGAFSTHVSAINNNGVAAGYYELPDAQVFGFLYKDGQFETVMHPGRTNTGMSGINDHGVVVGTYSPSIGLPLTFKGVPIK